MDKEKVYNLLKKYHVKFESDTRVRIRVKKEYWYFVFLPDRICWGKQGASGFLDEGPIEYWEAFIKRHLRDVKLEERFPRLIEEATNEFIKVMGHRPDVYMINTDNAKSRWGVCKHIEGKNYIQISKQCFEYSDKFIKEVLIHEMLHTEYQCQDHQAIWRANARKFDILGYDIQRTSKPTGYEKRKMKPKHELQCPKCKKIWVKYRDSNMTMFPETYNCPECHCSIVKLY